MIIGGFSSAEVASSVWSNLTRTLTSIVGGIVAVSGSPSVPNATVLDLRPAANAFRHVTIANGTGGVGFSVGNYDGTTFTGLANANEFFVGSGFGNSAVGISAKNNTGGASTFVYAGFDLT